VSAQQPDPGAPDVTRLSLGQRFRRYAKVSTHLYASLLWAMADDWDSGGVIRTICRDWEGSPRGAFVQLRLLAGIHRLVLTGEAPELVRFYPNLGGTADPAGAWPVFEPVLAEHVAELQQALTVAPQTNEPGRSVALLVGLFDAVRRTGLTRVRLFEPGASAGLNLLVDEFRIGGAQPSPWWSGPAASPLQFSDAVNGPVQPVSFTIVGRRGCDLSPVDAATEEGRIRLTSFVWPYQLERHERLRSALQVAAEHPVTVDPAGASSWLAAQLSAAPPPDVLTVVWHSVTRLYWPVEETARVGGLIAAAGSRMPLAHIAMEHPVAETVRPAELTVAIHRPGRSVATAVLGTVADHGVPVRCSAGSAQVQQPEDTRAGADER
jgi:hypothetical protein